MKIVRERDADLVVGQTILPKDAMYMQQRMQYNMSVKKWKM